MTVGAAVEEPITEELLLFHCYQQSPGSCVPTVHVNDVTTRMMSSPLTGSIFETLWTSSRLNSLNNKRKAAWIHSRTPPQDLNRTTVILFSYSHVNKKRLERLNLTSQHWSRWGKRSAGHIHSVKMINVGEWSHWFFYFLLQPNAIVLGHKSALIWAAVTRWNLSFRNGWKSVFWQVEASGPWKLKSGVSKINCRK